MLFLKLIQQLIKTLNSEGTPGQVAVGIAVGAALGLTPLLNLHNLVVFAFALVLNLSLSGFMLGWALFVPLGFLLDPLFDRVGQSLLLSVPPLTPIWTAAYNSFMALTNFNNSVVLGSFVVWLIALLPLYLVFKFAVGRYRMHVYERLKKMRLFKAVTASKAYNVYRMFRPRMTRRFFRWKAIVPLILFVGLVVGVWILLLDKLVERGIESVGEDLVGAKVDLEGATVHLAAGRVQLRKLQVADPDSPMQNLFEASEIVAAISPAPLLEKKIVIDSVLVHGVRFGTPRKESGALKNPSATSGVILRQVNEWAKQVRIPSLSLEGLGGKVINIPAISLDSLRTVSQGRRIVASADSLRQSWEGQVKSLDPSPKIDSAKAMLERLKAADPKALGVPGTTKLLSDARATINDLTGTLGKVKALETTVTTGVGRVKADIATLDDARRADYAYARGLVNLPSLDAPDISPALFGQLGIEKLKPILYWVNLAEKYLPPGLDPRTRTGPKRARAAGVDVDFPREKSYPKFLLRFADIDVSLTGQNLAAGTYRAQAVGFTTEPALYGKPMQFLLRRTGGQVGPNTAQVFLQLDHTKSPLRDSAVASIGGLTLPTVPVVPLGARVALGTGAAELSLSRAGEKIVGRWHVRTANATWTRTDSGSNPAAGNVAARAKSLAEDLVWRTVAGIRDVDIEAQISGTLRNPALSVRSNVGDAVANSLKKAVGEEVARAERLVRAKVDSLVADGKRQVDEKVAVLQTQFQERVTQQREQLDQVKSELEAKVKEKASGVTGGIQLPGGIKLPR